MYHLTVTPKSRPEFYIETGENPRVQENILNYLYSNGGKCDFNELLPTSFYRKEDLKKAIEELVDKDKISEENGYYSLEVET